ncbi:MAG: TonB-dependent receptor [Candidatus Acidiferrum sp.]
MKSLAILRLEGVRPSFRACLLTGLALCLLLSMFSGGLRAQGLSGITGTVTDSTGAVVPDAKVTATNNATGVASHGVTSSFGTYTITDLIPGTYTVVIEKQGFARRIISGVHVDVSRTTTADADLNMGATTESIEVTSPEISLETTQPQLGTIVENKLVEEIPVLIGGGPGNIGARDRQIDDYLFIAPGVQGGEFSHRINGGVDFENEVMFNGVVANQSETQGLQSNINPPFDMVSEIQVLTSNFSAQYGLAQGVASYQFASGTNVLHGNVFEILRNTALNAAGANPPGTTSAGKGPTPVINQHNYGFSVGGPVWFPKLYNGKSKTFFHFSADWFRLNQTDQGTYTVPTPAEVAGDFSGYVDSTGNQIPIYVPQGFVAPSGCTAPAPGNHWPGNIIPTPCFSTNSASLLKLIPAPNLPGLTNNATSHVGVLPTRQTNWGFSIDHNLTDSQKVHVSYYRNKYDLTSCCNVGIHVNNELSGLEKEPRLGTGFFMTYSNAISSHLVMTAGFAWMGEINDELNSFLNVNFPGVASGIVLPTINFNAGPLGSQATSWGLNSHGETFSINRKLGLSFDNNWLWTHGRHTMNIGWEIRRSYQDDHECQQCGGSFSFSSRTTADPLNIDTTGSGFASYLLGYADSSYRQFALETKLRNFYVAPYIQDDIKINPRLTVNVGLRWDIMRPFTTDPVKGQPADTIVFFNPAAANSGAVDPSGQPLLGAAGVLGSCSTCSGFSRADLKWTHFSPRVGFAYQINKKTVLLSGFALNFLDGGAYEYGDNKLAVQYGSLLAGIKNVNSLGSNIPAYGQWDGNPVGVPQAAPFSPTLFNAVGGLRQFGRDPGKYPYSQSWNAGIQRELPYNMFLSVAYIGNRVVHLPSMLNPVNQTNPKYLTQFCPNGIAGDPNCPMSPGSPNFAWTSALAQSDLQEAGFSLCPNGTSSAGFYAPYCNFMNDYGSGAGLPQSLLPYPMYNPSESCATNGLCNPFDTNGTAVYNALQVQTQKRYSSGVSFLVSYTLSKTMSNTDTGFASFNWGSENKYNQKSEWSIAGNDQTHLLNITTVYELPIGPGKKVLNKGGIVAKNLLGGWQMSGVFQYASGTPNVVLANNNDPFLNGINRANYNPQVALHVNYNNYYKGLPVFTQGAFSDPGFVQGNEPRILGGLRNPFSSNENLALAKHFFFGERVTAELRVEFFNVLNRMQVCNADFNFQDGPNNFGFVNPSGNGAGPGGSNTCQGNTPRQGQAFFKISF